MEKLAPIKGYEQFYMVSNFGKIYRLTDKGLRKIALTPDKNGYLRVHLSKKGEAKHYFVHRIVAETFIPNSRKADQVNHMNGVKSDNSVNNLEWVDCYENLEHSYLTGLHERKAVEAYDEKGMLIHKFKSTREAGRIMGVSNAAISCACRKGSRSCGLRWRFCYG